MMPWGRPGAAGAGCRVRIRGGALAAVATQVLMSGPALGGGSARFATTGVLNEAASASSCLMCDSPSSSG